MINLGDQIYNIFLEMQWKCINSDCECHAKCKVVCLLESDILDELQ